MGKDFAGVEDCEDRGEGGALGGASWGGEGGREGTIYVVLGGRVVKEVLNPP